MGGRRDSGHSRGERHPDASRWRGQALAVDLIALLRPGGERRGEEGQDECCQGREPCVPHLSSLDAPTVIA
jgi:hypothetical protein